MKQSSLFLPAAGVSGAAASGDAAAGGAAVSGTVVEGTVDLAGLLSAAHRPDAGAVLLFSGEVRDMNRGRAVSFLVYEAHVPLAEKVMAEVLAEAKERWGLAVAVAQHRIGRVEIGETAVAVITAAAHRGEAYEANRYIIDRIKHEAPIWKCEYYADGTKEWSEGCNQCK
jgi:molybdopterin synthase catalytic subunit